MLLDTIYNKYKIVSIVGMAKNSGKTVALNHLITEAMEEGIGLGIISTGRDGEAIDVLTQTEKPKIFAEVGSIIATTTEMLGLGDATIEILRLTGHRTPLGELVIGRVKNSGYIQVAGPQTAGETKEVAELILELGAELVLIDGALDRRSSAAPSISEASILATGAVISRDINKVVEETMHTVSLFKLAFVENSQAREAIKSLIDENQIGLVDKDYKAHSLNIKTALNSGHIIGEHIDENTKYIVLPGCLVKSTLDDLVDSTRKYKDLSLVVRDGTRIFIPARDWLKYERRGIKVKVLNSINLAAITVNPYSPEGYYFEAEELLEKIRFYIKDIPVVDLVLEGI